MNTTHYSDGTYYLHTYANSYALDQLTAERLDTLGRCSTAAIAGKGDQLAALILPEGLNPWLLDTRLSWRGLCCGLDYFTLALVNLDGVEVASAELALVTVADLDARDRERLALARAHRAAGIAVSIGGAQ